MTTGSSGASRPVAHDQRAAVATARRFDQRADAAIAAAGLCTGVRSPVTTAVKVIAGDAR